MMLRFIFISIFILVTNSFAIKDVLQKPEFNIKLMKVLHKNYPLSLSSSISEDSYNVFIYNTHFRVIYGKSYKNSTLVQNLAKKILDIASNVWQKEVGEMGFKPPVNSDKYYIDIYIANSDAFNGSTNEFVSLSDDLAGYAALYGDRTPYIVVNPNIGIDILKVTIAHEFFHTIQYAYGLDLVNYNIWDKNVWFMEATAVMMEDEVYDNVNDYINYLKAYTNNTNLPLEYHNLSIEYGKVLFAKYLREKFGIGFIKNIFENYNINEPILESIKKCLKDVGFSLKDALLEFAQWMLHEDKYFKDGYLYPKVKKYSIDSNVTIGNYGVAFFDKGPVRYLTSSNPNYLQRNFSGDENVVDNIDDDGLIVLNAKSRKLYSSFLQGNSFKGIYLKRGWNLISNIFNENLYLENIFKDNELIWLYRDGKYYAYSPNEKLQKIIEDMNLSLSENIILPNEGFWVYSNKDKLLNIDFDRLNGFNMKLKKGWNLISMSSSIFDLNSIEEPILVWHYNKKLQEWELFSNENIGNVSYKKFYLIKPGEAYFIYKN